MQTSKSILVNPIILFTLPKFCSPPTGSIRTILKSLILLPLSEFALFLYVYAQSFVVKNSNIWNVKKKLSRQKTNFF